MQHPVSSVRWFLMLIFLTCHSLTAAELPGSGADADKTVVYRDTWGVPHIYSPTVEGGMYAMGWTQAQDRPVQLLRNLARGIGEISRADGQAGVQSDVVAKTFRLYESSKESLERIDADLRSQTQAFVKGINDWYAAHPDDVPDGWGDRPVDEAMIVAFGRLFLHGWSIDDGFGDLKRAGIEPGFDETERASNQWAVSAQRQRSRHSVHRSASVLVRAVTLLGVPHSRRQTARQRLHTGRPGVHWSGTQ